MRQYHRHENLAFGIFLRFGSLTDDSHVVHSYEDIRYITGIPQTSMVRIIAKWRSVGKDITRYSTQIKRSRWPLTPEMEAWAVSPDVIKRLQP
jgi:hypothetical protein